MKIKCDQCKMVFELSEDKIIENIIQDDIKEKYFVCPECNKHFSVIISDSEMRQAIQRRKIIQGLIKNNYKGSKNLKQIKRLMAEDNELKKFLEVREKELYDRYHK